MWALNTCGEPNEIELSAAHVSLYCSFPGGAPVGERRHQEVRYMLHATCYMLHVTFSEKALLNEGGCKKTLTRRY